MLEVDFPKAWENPSKILVEIPRNTCIMFMIFMKG